VPPPAPTPGPSLLVLGLGNDILTDDAVGLYVVRQLKAELADCPEIEVRETTEMGLTLLDQLSGFSAAVIVDSIQTGKAAPGFIHELDPASLKQLRGSTPHFVGVGETLAMGRQLGIQMPETIRIFAIEVADPFTLGTSLSPVLQTQMPAIVANIRDRIQALLP
jgi:hydrogenase maturation protease